MKVVVLVDRNGYKTVQESDVPKGYDYVIHSQDDVTVRCPRKDVKPLLDMFICREFNKKVDEIKVSEVNEID